MGDNLMLFLMVICHQPYSELDHIPVSTAHRLEQRFGEIVNDIFAQIKQKPDLTDVFTNKVLPNLPPLEDLLK